MPLGRYTGAGGTGKSSS